ncbi:MAG: hypothetical protein Q7R45_08240 [Sulfuricaulis sp.]|nr:hypothetical protein [Sulfuricaulis sp.]
MTAPAPAHTPWKARPSGDDDGLWTVESADGEIIFFGMEKDRALLFAAAPKMLAALKAEVAVKRSVTLFQERELRVIADKLTAAAIAVATGERP